jgi:hypothetical protein
MTRVTTGSRLISRSQIACSTHATGDHIQTESQFGAGLEVQAVGRLCAALPAGLRHRLIVTAILDGSSILAVRLPPAAIDCKPLLFHPGAAAAAAQSRLNTLMTEARAGWRHRAAVGGRAWRWGVAQSSRVESLCHGARAAAATEWRETATAITPYTAIRRPTPRCPFA